jgi:hypothetical protein
VDVVTDYRTDVIHYGYPDLGASGYDWREVWVLTNFLLVLIHRPRRCELDGWGCIEETSSISVPTWSRPL